jgi:hypothetical protein
MLYNQTMNTELTPTFKINLVPHLEALGMTERSAMVRYLHFEARVSRLTAQTWVDGTVSSIKLQNLRTLARILKVEVLELLDPIN